MARKAKASTKAQPPPASTPVFSAAKWVSVAEAFERAAHALGSDDLASRDLPEDLLSGRLSTAMRRISPDGGVDTFEPIDDPSSFWKGAQVCRPLEDDPDGWVSGLDAKLTAGFYLFFFVLRSDLDKLYPVGRALEPASPPRERLPTRRHDASRDRKQKKIGNCTSPPSCIAL
jgi:hypothetical protein